MIAEILSEMGEHEKVERIFRLALPKSNNEEHVDGVGIGSKGRWWVVTHLSTETDRRLRFEGMTENLLCEKGFYNGHPELGNVFFAENTTSFWFRNRAGCLWEITIPYDIGVKGLPPPARPLRLISILRHKLWEMNSGADRWRPWRPHDRQPAREEENKSGWQALITSRGRRRLCVGDRVGRSWNEIYAVREIGKDIVYIASHGPFVCKGSITL